MPIENVQSIEAVRELYEEGPAANLVGHQVGLRHSIHAMEWLIANRDRGATPEGMLADLKLQLHTLHEVAHARGVQLLGYQPQGRC